jgi:hypothetical protein
MTPRALRLASIAVLAVACGGSTPPAESPSTEPAAGPRAVEPAEPAPGSDPAAETTRMVDDASELTIWKPGEYHVYRFSGSYRQVPLVLKEKLVEIDGELSTTEYTLDENGSTSVLEVQKIGPEVFSVSRIDAEGKTEIGVDAFETLMETTTFAADANLEMLGTEDTTLLVGGREIAAKRTRYLVQVDGQDAVLSVVTSDAYPGRDIGGELTLRDGTVVFRATLVEAGQDAPAAGLAAR